MSQRVTIEVADHVALVTLSRPEKHNALDRAMFEGIVEAADYVAQQPEVRAVVLHGAGPSFCSGLDVSAFGELDGIVEREAGQRSNLAQRTCTGWIDVPAPVIAAVHGNCFGGGLQIALGADIRCVRPDTKLSVMEIKWGLVPDMSGCVFLTELTRADIARDLVFSGRIVLGEEAREIGLATHVSEDPLAQARTIARQIASSSPEAIRAGKRLLNGASPVAAARVLQAEADEQARLIGSPNQMEAVMAAMQKRAPVFR
jgi:enoyl-CoA hydratase/carnithine racemase